MLGKSCKIIYVENLYKLENAWYAKMQNDYVTIMKPQIKIQTVCPLSHFAIKPKY